MFDRYFIQQNLFGDYRTSAAQSIANVTIVKLTGLASFENSGLFFDSANDWIVLDPGMYAISMLIHWAANAVGQRRNYIFQRASGTPIEFAGDVQPANATAGHLHRITSTIHFALPAGDSLDFRVFQSSGAALNMNFAQVGIVKLADI